jgi:hypothetical protein
MLCLVKEMEGKVDKFNDDICFPFFLVLSVGTNEGKRLLMRLSTKGEPSGSLDSGLMTL